MKALWLLLLGLTAGVLIPLAGCQAPPIASTPPTAPSARITGITVEDAHYVVAYETFGFTETLPGRHVHFFFNTVPPAEAVVPGAGPWELYGGPRPFKGYQVADRPAGATQMCILVAEEDHTGDPNSGNCVDLP